MIVQKMVFSDVFAANCYFYTEEKSKHGFLIDPSAHAEFLLEHIQKNKLVIEKILLTHSHLDHIGAATTLSKVLGVDVFGIYEAKEYLSNPHFEAHFTDWDVLKNMKYLTDGDDVVLSTNKNVVLKVLATPGHTIDSAVYFDAKEQIAFTGDTIFEASAGRTDIPGAGGDYEKLMLSIKNKILNLPENTVLYPGHGEATTVKNEKHLFLF